MMRTARNALRRFIENGDELCVTTQILAEFWNVCTRPADVNGLGNSIGGTDRLMSRIEAFFTLLPDQPDVFRRWRALIVAHEVRGAKVHDTRLVPAVMTFEVERILTFNTADFRRFWEVVAVNPIDL